MSPNKPEANVKRCYTQSTFLAPESPTTPILEETEEKGKPPSQPDKQTLKRGDLQEWIDWNDPNQRFGFAELKITIHETQRHALYPKHPSVGGQYNKPTGSTCIAGRGEVDWRGGNRKDTEIPKYPVLKCNTCEKEWV